MCTPIQQTLESAHDRSESPRDKEQLCQSFYARYGKRVFDIFFSIFGLISLSPVLVVVACCIKLTSRGPILYRQIRMGKDSREFEVLKFRSMVKDTAGKGLRITTSGDRRVTRIGRLLRDYKIDELPQLWNVLRGEMSFVGPRPELPHYVAGYSPQERVVLSARPGITDPSSLAYLNEEEILASHDDPENVYRTQILPDKLARSIAYLRRVSIATDLRIIIQTLAHVGRPANKGVRARV